MAIYIANFGLSIQDDYKGILSGNGDTIPVPMTPDQFAKYIADPTDSPKVCYRFVRGSPFWSKTGDTFIFDTEQR